MSHRKRRYEKPSVERVELTVPETVLTFCKGPGGSGPMVGACRKVGPGPGPCQVKGT